MREQADRPAASRDRSGAHFRASGRHGAALRGRRQIRPRGRRGRDRSRSARPSRARHCGTFGHSAVLSFNGNKIVTTGGGGMILTDDDAHAARARHFTTTAKQSHAWAFDHDEVAYNYRLPNINAALGCAQMERLPAMVEAKRELAERYLRGLRRFRQCRASIASRRAREATTGSTRWCSTANTPASATGCWRRCTPTAFTPGRCGRRCTCLPMYRDCPRSRLPVAEDMYARCINLPSSPFLAASEQTARTRSDAPSCLLHHSQHDAVVEISWRRALILPTQSC